MLPSCDKAKCAHAAMRLPHAARAKSLASSVHALPRFSGEFSHMGVSENWGTLVWGPCNKAPTIWRTILGSPIFGNSHIEG